MNICDKISLYLTSVAPRRVTTRQIRDDLLIVSHEKVFHATQSLLKAGTIKGSNTGATWKFWKPAEPLSVVSKNSSTAL